MTTRRKTNTIILTAVLALCAVLLPLSRAQAALPTPGPSSNSVGVEGRIPKPAPTQAAVIISPANGASFTTTPITVTGSCPKDTIVKIFSNNIFVGSVQCINGSFSLQISLFNGRNDLVAKVSDALDQEGPDSKTVTVTYSDPQFAQFGNQVLLTSQYGRLAANLGDPLTWPVVLSGGSGPYAFSVDWGDGTPAELKSIEFAGVLQLTHTYKTAGVYNVIFKVVDRNGSAAFLQVLAVINGPNAGGSGNGTTGAAGVGTNGKNNGTVITKTRISWQLPLAFIILLPFGFWLGRHAELTALRKRLEREYNRPDDDDF